jgi:predicted HTH transcriptional regulator
VLYIGVANDGAIAGLTPADLEKVQQQVRRICEEDCFPAIAIKLVEIIETDDRRAVAFEFSASPNKPHFAGHAYQRIGSSSVKASASKLEELIASKNTTAGRLIAAKDSVEHLTLIRPAGAIVDGNRLARTRESECTVLDCNAHHAKFYDISSQEHFALSLKFLSLSWDIRRNRLLVEYIR